jgi:hypothetical protein
VGARHRVGGTGAGPATGMTSMASGHEPKDDGEPAQRETVPAVEGGALGLVGAARPVQRGWRPAATRRDRADVRWAVALQRLQRMLFE